MGKLSSTPPQVPPPYRDNDLVEFRKSLPIYTQRNDILEAIEQNQVSCNQPSDKDRYYGGNR